MIGKEEKQVFEPNWGQIRRDLAVFATMGLVGTPILSVLKGIDEWLTVALLSLLVAMATVLVCSVVFLLPTPRRIVAIGESLRLERKFLWDTELHLPEVEKIEPYMSQVRLYKYEEHHAIADMTLRMRYFTDADKKELVDFIRKHAKL